MSDSVQPHRWQPTRLACPWDSPGKNTGVGCHFLLQCMKVKSESEDAQSCPTLSNPIGCSLPGSTIHGIFQARVLEWGAIAFSEGSLGSQYIVAKGGWDLDTSTLVTSVSLWQWWADRASVSLDLKCFRKFLWRSYARLDWKPLKNIIRIFNAGYYSAVPLVEQGDPIRMEVSLEFFSWDIAGWYRRKESFPTKMALITH